MGWIKKTENKWIVFGGLVAVVALGIPFLIMWLSKRGFNVKNFTDLSPIGDYFGGTTVGLLSLASMLFVIAAIVMQKEELNLQRNELKLTREELEKTREQHELSNHTLKLQQFETTFFNMINMHSNLINDLKLYGKEFRGREVFVKFFEDVNNNFKEYGLNTYFNDLILEYAYNIEDIYDEYLEFLRAAGGRIYSYYGHELDAMNLPRKDMFINRANSIISGNPMNEIGETIEAQSVFGTKYDELLIYANREGNLTFSRRIKKEYFNNQKYKISAFDIVNRVNKYPFSNYIKSVKSIIKFLDLSNFDTKTKNDYLNIFFSQFSIQEITVLDYFIKLGNEDELEGYFNKYDSLNIKEKLKDSII